MEELFNEVLNRLAEIPELKDIDLDWGQLDEPDDNYPVDFPCALVDIPEIDWTETGTPFQQGDTKLLVKIGINIAEDTHIDSGTTVTALAKLAPVKLVNKKLHRWKPAGIGKLTRKRTRIYNLAGIKVVEMEYSCEVTETAV